MRNISANPGDLAEALPGMLARLWRFALHLVRSPIDAEWLIERACARALEVASNGHRNGDTYTALISIMCSIWADDTNFSENLCQRASGSCDSLPSVMLPAQASIDDRHAFYQEIREAVDTLPNGQRLIVLLIEVEGLSYVEAERILGMPAETIAAQLASARLAVARRLAACSRSDIRMHA